MSNPYMIHDLLSSSVPVEPASKNRALIGFTKRLPSVVLK